MARTTPEQAANKWRDRLSAATTQITDGVNAVTVAPGSKAAASADLWLQRVQQAKDKFKTNVGRVSLQEWQAATIAGVPRVAQGAQAKVGKVQSFMGEFLPYLDRGKATIDAMPKGDISMSIARATAQIQWNAAFKRGRA